LGLPAGDAPVFVEVVAVRPGVVAVDPVTGAAYFAVRDCALDPIVATIPVMVDGAGGSVEVLVDVSAGHVVGFEFLSLVAGDGAADTVCAHGNRTDRRTP
jgi:hypothetical protein